MAAIIIIYEYIIFDRISIPVLHLLNVFCNSNVQTKLSNQVFLYYV